MTESESTVHASAVTLGETGILIRGPSGSGKSSLALALLTASPNRARLIADDRVVLTARGGRLLASAPPAIAGLLEIRGLGISSLSWLSPALIRMVVDLLPIADVPRMPARPDESIDLAGVRLPRVALPALAPDGHVRVARAASQIA